ncbi:MAG: hypothetical protein GY796_01415 [Chloroflexi bacterium]|nr:hypothetical protein [Chloroflexota bacterium]
MNLDNAETGPKQSPPRSTIRVEREGVKGMAFYFMSSELSSNTAVIP